MFVKEKSRGGGGHRRAQKYLSLSFTSGLPRLDFTFIELLKQMFMLSGFLLRRYKQDCFPHTDYASQDITRYRY